MVHNGACSTPGMKITVPCLFDASQVTPTTHATQGYNSMYVCMVITYSKNKDQPGKVADPARDQLNRKNKCSPVPVRA